MKKLIALASCVALAACSQGEADAPAEGETDATMTAEAPAAVDGDTMAGTYDVTAADGTTFTASLNADGTYTDTAADGSVMESGTFVETNGQTCFNSSEEGAAPNCWTVGEPAEDGTISATNDDGETVTMTKR